MKNKFLLSILISISGSVAMMGQSTEGHTNIAAAPPMTMPFDSTLAHALGADVYGMRAYVMVFLKTGPNPVSDPQKKNELMRGHLDNIRRLAADGMLSLAGPFMDDSDYRGIFVFNVKTVEEAKALVETDPAVQSGVLIAEMHPWYGSAALMKINEIHPQIQRKSF